MNSEIQQHLVQGTHSPRVKRRMLWAIAALLVLLSTGTWGFLYFGGPGTTLMDAFYMTAITITTVGYSEVVHVDPSGLGRLFTAGVAFGGFGLLTFLFSSLTVFFLETDLNETLRRRRMEKTIRKLHQHYIVCGFGRVGRNVGAELVVTNHRFVAIEPKEAEIEQFLARHPGLLYLQGDASDDDMLLKADIADAQGVFAVTGDDSRNLMICLTARQLNPKVRIVARCHEIRNAEKMRKAGADVVVSPDFTGGMRIASSMIRPQVASFLDEMLRSEQGTRIDEVRVPENFAGCAVGDLGRRSPQYVLLGVRTAHDMHFNPADDFLIEAGQTLILMGNSVGRTELLAQLNRFE